MNLNSIVAKCIEAVTDVGKYVLENSESFGTIYFKDIKNPQTKIDIEAEKQLVMRLSKILPEAGFILEEGETKIAKEYNWIIDPIENTKLYSTNFPFFFTQIALQKNKITIFSIIYQPISKQMFYAIKNEGTYLSQNRMSITYDGPLKNSIVSLELGKIETGVGMDFIQEFAPIPNRLWITQGIFTPYILTNTIQAYMRYHSSSNTLYDLEPRWLLIREAGGVVHEHKYKGRKLYIAAHPKLVSEIESVLGI